MSGCDRADVHFAAENLAFSRFLLRSPFGALWPRTEVWLRPTRAPAALARTLLRSAPPREPLSAPCPQPFLIFSRSNETTPKRFIKNAPPGRQSRLARLSFVTNHENHELSPAIRFDGRGERARRCGWPLALLALIAWPFLWLLSIPFRIVAAVMEALLALVKALLFLPAKILGPHEERS